MSDRREWDEAAATFDEEPDHGLRDPQVRAAWAGLLASHLPEAPSDVVDLGCGTGTLSLLLAQAGHRVRGLDLSPAMVAAAVAKTATFRGPGTVTIDEGDAARPPYPSGCADVVLCRHVLWALPDPEAVLGRWVSLLRPGGRLVLVEGRWHTGGGLTAEECQRLVLTHRAEAHVVPLPDPAYWGADIDDERYLLVSRS